MVKIGDRFRFVPHDGQDMPAQTVEVCTATIDDDRFYAWFTRKDGTRTQMCCRAGDVAGIGHLEPLAPIEPKRAKQHDEISLDEWRYKIRSMG